MKYLIYILFFSIAFINHSCIRGKSAKEISYCTLIWECIELRHNNRNSNERINEIIPLLENKTKIEANCDKGYLGYLYNLSNDSTYYSDLYTWSTALKCSMELQDSLELLINVYNE